MWVEKKQNGTFIAKERYTDPFTGKTKKVAVVIEKDTKAARKAAERILWEKINALTEKKEDANVTLEELAEKYIGHQKKNTKPQTWHRDEYVIDKITSILGPDVYAKKVTARFVDDKFRGTGKENVTLNSYLKHFKQMFRWAYRADYVEDIGFLAKLQPYPDKEKKSRIEDKYLTSDELKKLLEHMKVTRWKLLTHFLALSGLRIGEAIALNDSDVTDVITVNKTVDVKTGELSPSAKTDAGNRQIHIQPELTSVIRKIRLLVKKESLKKGYRSDLFFPDEKGMYLSYYAYNKYLRENTQAVVGRALTPHALRHTHVSLLAENGVPLDAISRRVGHEDSKVTKDIYLHITEKQKEKDNAVMDSIRILI